MSGAILQWTDKAKYKDTLEKLGALFQKNFETFVEFEMGGQKMRIPEEVLKAGPVL